MLSFNLVLVFCVVLSLSTFVQGELVFVSILFRHGDRTPIHFYQNDPYKNASYWPTGPGQLTNTGKLQHFELGQWFGKRYRHLIGDSYSKENLYVVSTDVDRTLMSAEANLAGLFPPEGKQVWDPAIKWQPIPVHTIPEKMDKVLAMKKPCPQYEAEKAAYLASPELRQYRAKYAPLFHYVSQHAGEAITSITDLEFLHNTLYIEDVFNYTLPAWTRPVFPRPMSEVAAFSFSVAAATPTMKRLKGGPLLDDIVKHMVAKSKQKLKKKKMWIYSAHDTTVANLLNTLDVFDIHCPPYASAVMIELHLDEGMYFVRILYRNSTSVPPYRLTIPGCDFDCPLDQFLSLTAPVTISDSQWEEECHAHHRFLNFVSTVEAETSLSTLVLLTMAILLGLLMVSLVFYLHRQWRLSAPAHLYERI